MRSLERYLDKKEHIGLQLFVQQAKKLLKGNLITIKLFGSKVRGDSDIESDIDVLLILRKKNWEICHNISVFTSNINLEYDCLISPVIYSEVEHQRNKYFNTLFVRNIDKEGIPL